ncbi:MAG TPA: 50S ribosomal protein L13 [Acidimicrobiales bacterium]
MATYTPKAADITRAWHVVDADGLVLGRLATEVARVLRGKHKPIFAPHMDCGDHVIVVNASKIAISGDTKATSTFHFSHSGFPGGISQESLSDAIERHPDRVVRRAVRGMLPKTRLGRAQIGKLKVYAGAEHPHHAQKPQPLDIPGARRS